MACLHVNIHKSSLVVLEMLQMVKVLDQIHLLTFLKNAFVSLDQTDGFRVLQDLSDVDVVHIRALLCQAIYQEVSLQQ